MVDELLVLSRAGERPNAAAQVVELAMSPIARWSAGGRAQRSGAFC